MKNSASIYWASTKGIQVSRFSDEDGQEYSFGYVGDFGGIIGGVTSIVGVYSVSLYSGGRNESDEAVSFIGISSSYGRVGNIS